MAAPTDREAHGLRALFSFDTLITPRLMSWLYALLLIASALGGVAAVLRVGPTFPGFASGLVVAGCGAVIARIACELLLVLFRINEHMQSVSRRL
ncbi:MAG: DUF4282 domain-containing protein [Caldimonas sp.]